MAPVRAAAARSGRESPGECRTPFGLGRLAFRLVTRDYGLSYRLVIVPPKQKRYNTYTYIIAIGSQRSASLAAKGRTADGLCVRMAIWLKPLSKLFPLPPSLETRGTRGLKCHV